MLKYCKRPKRIYALQQDRFKHIEHSLCNHLFRKLFDEQATLVMCDAVLNYILADLRLNQRLDERRILKTNA